MPYLSENFALPVQKLCPICPKTLPYLSKNFALSVRKLCPTCPKASPYLSENFALSVRKLCPICPKTLPYLSENFALSVRKLCPVCPKTLPYLSENLGTIRYLSSSWCQRRVVIFDCGTPWKSFEPSYEIMVRLSSVNSFFKRACAAIQWGYMSHFWSDLSSTSILNVCEQRRLWRDCVDAQARLSLRWSSMR